MRTCVNHHQMLHDHYAQLTPLAQLMRRHKPIIFLRILTSLLDTDIMSLETAVKLLQGGASVPLEGTSINGHVTQLLEKVLNDHRRHLLFPEAAVSDTFISHYFKYQVDTKLFISLL